MSHEAILYDPKNIAHSVAERLRFKGFNVIVRGFSPCSDGSVALSINGEMYRGARAVSGISATVRPVV